MQLPNALQISFHIGARQMTRPFWVRTKTFAEAGCMAVAAKFGLVVNQNNRIEASLALPKTMRCQTEIRRKTAPGRPQTQITADHSLRKTNDP